MRSRRAQCGRDGAGAGWLALRPMSPRPCPTTLRRLRASPCPCEPGLESPHTSLNPWQEAEALAGEVGPEATVQGEQRLGATLGAMLLQLPPARLLQQDLGAETWAGGRPSPRARGRVLPSSPEASASSPSARYPALPSAIQPRDTYHTAHCISPPPNSGLVPE